MNLQEKINSETQIIKVTLVDTRGWHTLKRVMLATNLFFAPIVVGAALQSVILEGIGIFLGVWMVVQFIKRNSIIGKSFSEFGSIPAAIEHLKKMQREELDKA